jgi:hypothetical protein
MQLNLRNRDGFALPMAILMSAVLAAGLAASLVATSGQFNTNAALRGQNRAYNFAESGLQQFLSSRSSSSWCADSTAAHPRHCVPDPAVADSEWARVILNGGYADIVARRVRPVVGTANAIYFIRSTGVDTSTKLNGRVTSSAARHTVGVYASWTSTNIQVKAAWVSLSGLNKSGTGVISGIDQCGAQPSLAGVMVPKGDLSVSGGSFNPQGNPPVDTSKTFNQVKSQTNIDWQGILNGSIPADYVIPGDAFPSATWFDNNPDAWPIIRVHTNNYSLPNRGRGMIIADSNFTISGSNMWDGVVLIGGALTSNGNNTTAGATLSGLNLLLGGNPGESTVDDADANGQKTYTYDSCKVSSATKALSRYAVMTNTWMDNLAAY